MKAVESLINQQERIDQAEALKSLHILMQIDLDPVTYFYIRVIVFL